MDIRGLWRVAFGAVLAACLAGAGAALVLQAAPNTYEATATLLLVPLPAPKAFEELAFEELIAKRGGENWKVQVLRERVADALLLPLEAPKPPQSRFQLSMPDYAIIFRTEDMAAQVRDFAAQRMQELGAQRPAGTRENWRDRMQVRPRLLAQTFNDLVYQEALELSVVSEYPQIAAETANFWAEACIARAAEIRTERTAMVRRYFDDRLNTLQQLLNAATDEDLRAPMRTQYQLLSALRETAGLDTAEFLLVGPALQPERAAGPRRGVMTAAAALVGGFLVLCLAGAWWSVRRDDEARP